LFYLGENYNLGKIVYRDIQKTLDLNSIKIFDNISNFYFRLISTINKEHPFILFLSYCDDGDIIVFSSKINNLQ